MVSGMQYTTNHRGRRSPSPPNGGRDSEPILRCRGRSAGAGRAQKQAHERILGILKNGVLGRRLLAKTFVRREVAVVLGVLTHNLRRPAHLRKDEAKAKPPPKKSGRGLPHSKTLRISHGA